MADFLANDLRVEADMTTDAVPPGVDPTVPSAGRLYDYYLGGTEHFELDRKAAELVRMAAPELEDAAWANRGFLQRSAKWLAAEAGVRQFIDIGAGLPTRNNTHEAAQAGAPDVKTVYFDNDPMVIAHAKSLIADTPNTIFCSGDLRDPDSILDNPELRDLLDLSQPVALMLVAVVHFIADKDDPPGLVGRYMSALAPGSYLALSHGTTEKTSPVIAEQVREIYEKATEQLHLRSKAEIASLFTGLELVSPYEGAEPGLTHIGLWGAEDPEAADSDGSRWAFCGVARKP
jgi:hypothetical protein